MAKKKTASKSAAETVRFEDALEELQEIVSVLEDGSVGLEESMEQFEHGVGLLRTCYKTLEQAEQKIEILTRVDEDGNVETEAFDAASTEAASGGKAGRRKAKSKEETAEEGGDTLF